MVISKFYIKKVQLLLFFLFCIACSKDRNNEEMNIEIKEDPLLINARQFYYPNSEYIMVAAHRGGYLGTSFPENSTAAIQNSLDLGVDIIEIDIRITADSELVVMHDKTLDRTSNGNGLIKEHTLEEIKSLYLKDENGLVTNERIPTLAEVMNTVKNKALVFIDKSEYLVEYVVPVLKETNSISQSLFMDFIEISNASLRYGSLLEEAYFVPGIHNSNKNLDQYYFDYKKIMKPNPSAFAFWFKEENTQSVSLMGNAVSNNIPVWVNTTNSDQCAGHDDDLSLSNPDAGWGWVINKGATIIFTDRPKLLVKYLENNGFRE